uniref:4-hydroxy-tetrahydrodipicolinate reductase n=1 Tax=Vaginimicrobium propionicum TaxID=1871034 RepID=UPI0009712D66|nr:4-hydroxy-tetrahydrodipicolinate reductase [Vaginimicrobium propionicum]
MIKVAVFGAKGRMGSRICQAVDEADGLELVAALDAGDDRQASLAANVAIDFTTPSVVMDNIKWCLEHDIHVVVGTTGFDDAKYDQVRAWLAKSQANALIAANFSIAAVLMMSFAAKAAPFFESVEVIEMHHPRKLDAPSGTAAATAKKISAARQAAKAPAMPDATEIDPNGARGAVIAGVNVHAVRSQGLFAHQEVILGNPGEQLLIRDDSFDRSSYMPGIIAAVRAIQNRPGLTIGIDELLGIGDD